MTGSVPDRAGGATPPVAFLEVRVAGSHREIGRAVGEAARGQIAAAIAYYREHFVAIAGVEYAAAERRAMDYLAYARRYLPCYVEELEGMAEGSGASFLDLLVPNCAEEFTCPVDTAAARLPGRRDPGTGGTAPGGRPLAAPGCTAVAVAAGGRHVVGHNMDWYVVDIDKNVLFDVTCPDGTRFLTIAGVPYLPILGLNSYGVGYVGNSVYSADGRLGLPNSFVRRWVLEAPSVPEARARATLPARARGSNHLLADAEGLMWDVETSAGDAALLGAADAGADAGFRAHTNHYTDPGMVRYEGYWAGESRARLRRARTLLAEGMARGDEPLALVSAVLRDHEGGIDAICTHFEDDPRPERSVTVASMICDLDEMRVHVCAGAPCRNPYRTYAF